MAKVRKKKTVLRKRHRVWQLQEAKAHFSELVNEVVHDGYHTITKNGHPVVVVISKVEFEKLKAPKNTLLDFFLESPLPEIDLDLSRDRDMGREIDL